MVMDTILDTITDTIPIRRCMAGSQGERWEPDSGECLAWDFLMAIRDGDCSAHFLAPAWDLERDGISAAGKFVFEIRFSFRAEASHAAALFLFEHLRCRI